MIEFPARIGALECLESVERLHPMAESALELFSRGALSWQAFVRYFTLPHSDTLDAAFCLVDKFTPLI